MYCDHCQTTVVEGAKFCPFCGGKLTEAPAEHAMDPSQAPTVALTVGPCESCGAPSLPGSTLCLPCTRAFESILGTQPAAPVAAAPVTPAAPPVPNAANADAATLLQPQAPVLPSAPGGSASPEAATVLTAAVGHQNDPLADDPLGDDEEYEDEPDDLMAEEAATVLATPPPPPPPMPEPAAPAFAATDSMDWSTPAPATSDHEGIVALPPWARKGPDADSEPAAEAAPETPGEEPVPWWERNGNQSPTAAKPETARYVPPPAAAPPASASLESTLARQAMRPKSPVAVAAAIPAAPRSSGGNRSRTLVIGAALAGVAAIGTPVMWKLAFASRPTVVSALPIEPAAAPEPVAPRPERVHGTPAPAPAPAPAAPRVYQDLQPPAPEPVAPAPAPVAAAAPASTHATPKPSARKPAVTAAPVPVAAPVAPPPAPLLVATPPPVVAAPTAAAPPPASVQAEAVPLGQIFEVSQVEARPSVTSRFDPVLPARIASTTPVVVIVRVLVSPSGRAVESSPVKNPTNDAGVGAAAAAIVRQWSFAPARKKGQPVSCWVNVGVVFKAASGD